MFATSKPEGIGWVP